ncbi:STAS domain-containing protein [Bacillus sp. FJAT-44742]|uniref:STAS domain-containing protein n=1 Tax=Bacillus sp. FJAT-44742 TaxID=2014005 RepID=UPI0012FF43C0|nr:STAS domain-containing protein [Bacillus sp. FJAT-44742]
MLNEAQMNLIGNEIIIQKEAITREVEERINKNQGLGGLNSEELIQIRAEFVGFIGESLTKANIDHVLAKAYEWGKQLGQHATALDVPLDEALAVIPHYRNFIFSFINKSFQHENLTFLDCSSLAERINPTIDKIIYGFTQSYKDYHEKIFKEAKEELIELSVPIVPITKDVAILPLVGTLDTYRTQELMGKTLKSGADLGLTYLVIDLSGVHMIDTAVAQNLFQLREALQLLGITAIMAGVRPELAQTMVTLGISFQKTYIVRSLPEALSLTGVEIAIKNQS